MFVIIGLELLCPVSNRVIFDLCNTMSAQHRSNIESASFICIIVNLCLSNTKGINSNVVTVSTTHCLMLEQRLRLGIKMNPALGHRS